jgi:uncharacterized protein (TIGR02996 family)
MNETFPEYDAFLQVAQEEPEEDAPRLIFADWLEDRGGPAWAAYAEFIRNQIESAKLGNRSKHRRARLAARQRELLAAHQRTWLGPWAGGSFRWVFHRGIPTWMQAHAREFWIGQLLDRDAGFEDCIDFDTEGKFTLAYGDPNWGEILMGSVAGRYQLQFTFARVRVTVELWQVAGKTISYEGELALGGACLNLEEQDPTSSYRQRVRLSLRAPRCTEE